jgi:hypothetical protein
MATKTQQGSVKILWETATVDFASSLTLTSDDSADITVTGAALGDPVILGGGTAPAANTCYTAHVTAADTVKVRFNNYSGSTVNPASQTFTVGVIKLNQW